MPPPHAEFDCHGRLISVEHADVYFSSDGVGEARHVFLEGNDLARRFAEATGTFQIAETGFGTGRSFLVAADAFVRSARDRDVRLVFVSIENRLLDTETLEQVHRCLPVDLQVRARLLRKALATTPRRSDLRIEFDSGRIVLHVLLGDAHDVIHNHTFHADAWFLDGFAPAKNPSMWTTELLAAVATHTRAGGTFATYTAAGAVRRGLQAAGFEVQRAPGFGRKKEMLRGHLVATDASERDEALRPPRHVHVFGAGIASATAAHFFAARGAQVTVIDPTDGATAASRIPAAVVRPRLWPAGVGAVPDAAFVATAFRFTSSWLQALGSAQFRHCGVMLVEPTAEGAHKLQRRCANPATADLVRWLDAADARKTCGIEVPAAGGAWIPDGGVVDLGRLVAELLDHNAIQTARSTPEAKPDIVVLATARADQSGIRCPLQSVRGQAMAAAWPSNAPPPSTVLCTSGYFTPPDPDGRVWIGSTYDRGDVSHDVRVADDDRVREFFASWPALAAPLSDAAITERFAAVRVTTPDRLPLIGASTTAPNSDDAPTLVSLAHGSRGAVTAPFAAALLTALAYGEPLPIPPDIWRRLAPGRVPGGQARLPETQ